MLFAINGDCHFIILIVWALGFGFYQPLYVTVFNRRAVPDLHWYAYVGWALPTITIEHQPAE